MHVFLSLFVFWLLCRVTAACMKDLARVLEFDVAFFPAIVGVFFFLGGWLWFMHAGTYQ